MPEVEVATIERDELISALHAGHITLVDVLSHESFEAAHIPGAINLPVADIPQVAGELFPDRSTAIVAYCGGPT